MKTKPRIIELGGVGGAVKSCPGIEKQTDVVLVGSLINELNTNGISYCHWKSTNALERTATAENDVDLLVSRDDALIFYEILSKLGFKETLSSIRDQVPGVLNYYGYDPIADKFVHVHVHFQLALGHDLSKNYRIPLEEPLLRALKMTGMFPIPAPEFEYIIFVIRMVIKHCTWETFLLSQGGLSGSERGEYEYLRSQIDRNQVDSLLEKHLPCLDPGLFIACENSLQTGQSIYKKLKTGLRLQQRLEPFSRRPHMMDALLKIYRRYAWALQKKFIHVDPKQSPSSGGLFIAVIGGDGAGKSTAIDGLYEWLNPYFNTVKIHLGKPKSSIFTLLVRGILKIGRTLGLYPYMRAPIQFTSDRESIIFPGYPWLFREVCTARDRYFTYLKAKRYTNRGGLVISDRFPLPQVKYMDGPLAEMMTGGIKPNRLIRFMAWLEKKFYQGILPPDLLIVLKVDPDIAVQRKVDEEASSVRARSGEIWGIDWQQTSAIVIDASQPKAEVLSELKRLVWSNL
jgi:thymidylate kinase